MTQHFNTFDLLVPVEKPIKFDDYMVARNKWDEQFEKLKTEKQSERYELEAFFSQPQYGFSTIFYALKLKYRALITEPTTIEKTMSPWQLYSSNNPHWTCELTAEEADAVLKHTVGTCTLTEEEFEERYQKALSGELIKKPFNLHMFW